MPGLTSFLTNIILFLARMAVYEQHHIMGSTSALSISHHLILHVGGFLFTVKNRSNITIFHATLLIGVTNHICTSTSIRNTGNYSSHAIQSSKILFM